MKNIIVFFCVIAIAVTAISCIKQSPSTTLTQPAVATSHQTLLRDNDLVGYWMRFDEDGTKTDYQILFDDDSKLGIFKCNDAPCSSATRVAGFEKLTDQLSWVEYPHMTSNGTMQRIVVRMKETSKSLGGTVTTLGFQDMVPKRVKFEWIKGLKIIAK